MKELTSPNKASYPVKMKALLRRARNNMFTPGKLSEEHFWLLIELSSMHSDKVILALQDYLVFGFSRKTVCEHYNVNKGYFSTSLTRLINISNIVEQLLVYYQDDKSSQIK